MTAHLLERLVPSSLSRVLEAIGGILSPRRCLIAGRDALLLLWRYRALCRELVYRDLTGQYTGQALGSFWVVGHTLLMLLIYVFVFVVVLKVKIETSVQMPRDYTSYLFAGLVPWIAIAQILARSAVVLISQANLVKQVVFPIEVLPFGSVFSSLTPLAVGTVVLLVYEVGMGLGVPWTIILVPAYLTGLFLFMSGLAFLIAVVTPFFRDIKDFITVFVMAGMYLVPAFYLPAWVPNLFRPVLLVNPFSYPIWVSQDIFYFGRIEHPGAWIVFFILAGAFFAFGFRAFRSLKPYVADVL